MIEKKIKKKMTAVAFNYFVFFLMVAFLISCCMFLFVTALSQSLDVTFNSENMGNAAKITFANVLVLSFLCTMIDYFRRKLMVERPVNEITEVLSQLRKGDFSARIDTELCRNKFDHFDEMAEDINALAIELNSVETLRTDFIANVSHELKTPLSVIQNYGMLLQEPQLSEEKRMKYAKTIADSSRRLADLITNVLRLNKLENQQIFPTAEVYDLGEQLCECLLQFEDIWETKKIDIKTDIAEEVKIKADRELLSLVWNNLLSNAFKYTEQGGQVSVTMKAEGDDLVVEIKDTGCGFDVQTREHIFEKFYQGDTSHAGQGNGLGLALVKKVVDIMQGEIDVKSTLGQGSTFCVRLYCVW